MTMTLNVFFASHLRPRPSPILNAIPLLLLGFFIIFDQFHFPLVQDGTFFVIFYTFLPISLEEIYQSYSPLK